MKIKERIWEKTWILMKEWFQNKTLAKKFAITFVVLIFVPIMCVSMMSYYFGRMQIRKQYEKILLQETETINKKMQDMMYELDWLMLQMANQDQVKRFALQEADNHFEIYQMMQWCSSQIFLKRLLLDNKYVGRISIVGDKGIEYSFYGDSAQEYDKELYEHQAILDKAETYKSFLPTDGKCVFFLSKLKENSGTVYLTGARRFRADSDPGTDGSIFVEIKANMIRDLISNNGDVLGSVWILNPENEVVYQNDETKIGYPVSDFLDATFFVEESNYYVDNRQKELAVYRRDPITGYATFVELSDNEMETSIENIRLIQAFLIFCALPMTIGLVYQFAGIVQDKMEKRKAQLQALQMQINPHFLYNTLGAINTYALEANQVEIEQMVNALSNMFRYAAQDTLEPVKVSDEVEHVENYLAIMWHRHRIMPRIIWEVDTCMDQSILRLTIQPLVENAFQHAFATNGIQEGDCIIIRATVEIEDTVCVEVEDSGSGIPSLEKGIAYQLDGLKEIEFGIGLLNVHKRIQIVYGNAYGISVFCKPEGGTIVRIRLPKMKEEVI